MIPATRKRNWRGRNGECAKQDKPMTRNKIKLEQTMRKFIRSFPYGTLFYKFIYHKWNAFNDLLRLNFTSGGSKGDRGTPAGSKLFKFHAVFGKIRQNHMLASPLEGWCPHLGKSWIRHCLQQSATSDKF